MESTRFLLIHLFFFSFIFIFIYATSLAESATIKDDELLRGFTATPNASVTSFQTLLTDSTGNYSLAFLRVNHTLLALTVIHVPSSEQLWIANTATFPRWAASTQLFFNGSLVLSDSHSGVFWSTKTEGDRVWISNTSNVQIQKLNSTLWQTFDFPSDTLMENQNFTTAMTLVSSNGIYYMLLGSDFIGLYAKFGQQSGMGQIYLKHRALQAKAEIIEGLGPIYALLSSDGYLGMYQNGSVPVDVQAFNSFQQPGSGTRRVRLEADGNLKGYYWTGSSWILDYEAISESCDLPNTCGSFGLCNRGKGCSCLDNRTDYNSGKCVSPENNSGDFCSFQHSKYRVLRRTGVELPYKEVMGYEKMESLAQCESACKMNCTCWGVVYSNSSGFCYRIDYPTQTLVAVGEDSTKMGYFKVRESADKSRMVVGLGVGIGLLCGAILVFCGVVGFWRFKSKEKERGISVEEGGVGPYKDLASVSFRSIEMT